MAGHMICERPKKKFMENIHIYFFWIWFHDFFFGIYFFKNILTCCVSPVAFLLSHLMANTSVRPISFFSYRPILIKADILNFHIDRYQYTIFHISQYRNRYRISSNISYKNATKIFFTKKCNLEILDWFISQ